MEVAQKTWAYMTMFLSDKKLKQEIEKYLNSNSRDRDYLAEQVRELKVSLRFYQDRLDRVEQLTASNYTVIGKCDNCDYHSMHSFVIGQRTNPKTCPKCVVGLVFNTERRIKHGLA